MQAAGYTPRDYAFCGLISAHRCVPVLPPALLCASHQSCSFDVGFRTKTPVTAQLNNQ